MNSFTPILGDHCVPCRGLLKSIESCPRFDVFESGHFGLISLELLWVIASLVPVVVFSALVIHAITKKTLREFLILLNLSITQITCALLKRYFEQPRPLLACSTSFGYPSGHSGFTASLATWLILEAIMFHDQVPFKSWKFYSMFRNSLIVFAPFIPISRYFLNYHSIEQICYGLMTGFLCTVVYFGIVMSTLMHQGNGRLYKSVVFKVSKKYRFQDNFVNYKTIEERIEEKISECVQRVKEIEDRHIVHPIRSTVREIIESGISRINSFQNLPKEIKKKE